jgi:hypothetical protein
VGTRSLGTKAGRIEAEGKVASATAFKVMKMEFSPSVLVETIYTLPRGVSAIQVLASEHGEPTRLGLITQLPQGAEIEISGPGFSDGTVKVRCSGASYFVFLDDLETVKKHAAAAHA